MKRLERQPRWWALREVIGSAAPDGSPDREAVAPPGWGGTVEHMKEHEEIENPWALAWWMRNKGNKPHYKERKRKKGRSGMLQTDAETIDSIVGEVVTAKRETVKKRSRGTCVFQSTHPKVNDNKDHFPMNDLAQASNALARVMQYDSVPSWYDGTLKGLQAAVRRGVYGKYPGLKSRKEKREGKGKS